MGDRDGGRPGHDTMAGNEEEEDEESIELIIEARAGEQAAAPAMAGGRMKRQTPTKARSFFEWCGLVSDPHSRNGRALGLATMLARTLGASPESSAWRRALAWLAVSTMLIYCLARLAHDTVWDNPWKTKVPSGPSMPFLEYDFRRHHELDWWTIPEDERTYDFHLASRSLSPLSDKVEHARAEWFGCSRNASSLAAGMGLPDMPPLCAGRSAIDGAHHSGQSVSFRQNMLALQPDQIVALRFDLAGIRRVKSIVASAAEHIGHAVLQMEMLGEEELFPGFKAREQANLTMQIQVELSTHALNLRCVKSMRPQTTQEAAATSQLV